MKRILLFCAMGALCGCRAVNEPTTEVITLHYSTSESSKVESLTAGDEVAVWTRVDGAETYFLEGAKFITGSDGKTLNTAPTVHYPETKQAVNFYAYFPYHTGSFSVPSDQSTASALKQADLCWATTKSTPISVVPLQFNHLFARLIVSTNQTPSKIACLVVPSGTLNPATGQFTLSNTKSEVLTTQNELILPVQPLSRLILTVANVEYVFEGAINLQSGQTTTINLTVHPSTQTATLSGSSTTDWTASTEQGIPEQTASNTLSLHWANYAGQGGTPDKIILTINNTDYTITNGITWANKTFTVPFASATLRYPYTIQKIHFYQSDQPVQLCTQLLGTTIYKSGISTLGIKDIPNAIYIDRGGYKLWWATGNLVADGANGCKIGASADCGLYFGYGSLVGWSGGTNRNGTGLADASCPLSIQVRPTGHTGSTAFVDTYWRGGAPGEILTNILPDNATTGLGDACRFYLGAGWRIPTTDELYKNLSNLPTTGGSIAAAGGSWQATPPTGLYLYSNQLFFTVSGYRVTFYGGGISSTDLTFLSASTRGLQYGSSYWATGLNEGVMTAVLYEGGNNWFRYLPLRCVREVR